MSISSWELKKIREKHNLTRVQMAYIMRVSFESYEIREKDVIPVTEQEEKFLREFFDISQQEKIVETEEYKEILEKYPRRYKIDLILTTGDKFLLFRLYHFFSAVQMARIFCIPLTDYLELELDIRKPDDEILNVFCDFFGNAARNVLLTEIPPDILDEIV